MEKIKSIFQSSKDFALEQTDMHIIESYLENIEQEFRSVAYEAVSMVLALKDFHKENELNEWRAFAEGSGKDHAAQIHAGLGWTLAQEGKSALLFNDLLEPLMRYRVVDGYGYYDGFFRHRKTIKNKKLPEDLSGIKLKCYDQGVGRSIWYYCSGDLSKVLEIIKTFDASRHSDLWRGIGTASSYVGGLDEKELKTLFILADVYQPQLATGAALVARARVHSKTVTADVDAACRLWCNRSAIEVFETTEKLLQPLSAENIYEKWISAIEKEFISSDIIKNL
ncbi:MAG: DUF1702 family protein [Bacteroidia bacterium]